MKFGRNLSQYQVPEWAGSYIRYKTLKKIVRVAETAAKNGQEADLAEFLYSLDRDLENVDAFYNKKFAEYSRRLKLLQGRYGMPKSPACEMDRDEFEDLMGALLELRGLLRKLQWYGEVNRRGFVKITKKIDKKLPGTHVQMKYVATKVDPKVFAFNTNLVANMETVNTWLSNLKDVKIIDDASSTHSSISARAVSSRAAFQLSSDLLDKLNSSICNDDSVLLLKLLPEVKSATENASDSINQQLLLNLLQRSIYCRAKRCIGELLGQVDTLHDLEDITQRNCIHRLVISLGRIKATKDGDSNDQTVPDWNSEKENFLTPATAPMLSPNHFARMDKNPGEKNNSPFLDANDESVQLLQYLLDSLRPNQRSALKSIDSFGRAPLHYAAQYGFVTVCRTIVEHMQTWEQFDASKDIIDGPAWEDLEGWTPLHLSVLNHHPLTSKYLLDVGKGFSSVRAGQTNVSKMGTVLALATKNNHPDLVEILVNAGVDINCQNDQGETALHIAARHGHVECAKILLKGTDHQKADTEVAEKTYSWTPLHIAAVDGHLTILNLLIQHDADLEKRDSSGWTAKEHAALRGHIDIALRLADVTIPPAVSDNDSSSSPLITPGSTSLLNRTSGNLVHGSFRSAETVKSFGHRYLTDESLVLVSLGTMDMRKCTPVVTLDQISLDHAYSTELDTALSVVISATGARGGPEIVDLPAYENLATEPFMFYTKDPSKVKLLFDIVPTYAGSREKIVGRAVALLSSVKPGLGSKRSNLQGDLVAPIVAASTLDVIGSVTFNFLIVKPFSHPNMTITENHTYWKAVKTTRVIGHRGIGKNTADRKSLQLGENTIQSFIAAANLGASYVEFDVQLTKDHVPIIYHDFLVSETGLDAPVHTLTLEQFLHVCENHNLRHSDPTSPLEADDPKRTNQLRLTEPQRHRSQSVGVSRRDRNEDDLSERMKHTRTFKRNGFKANTRGNFIQAPFTTLEEMFKKLPPTLGFDIELKYPMLCESEEEEMDTYAVELNSFVDTVLTKVYDLAHGRNIIFTSFNPDVCILLTFKQPSIPVCLLTDAGVSPMSDIRASSLQEAIRFCSRWNLLGIVSAVEPLVLAPRLVRVVKESGLVLFSYGTWNNDQHNVKLQVNQGIDAVIVDRVLAIRKGLTGNDASTSTASSVSSSSGSGAASSSTSANPVVVVAGRSVTSTEMTKAVMGSDVMVSSC